MTFDSSASIGPGLADFSSAARYWAVGKGASAARPLQLTDPSLQGRGTLGRGANLETEIAWHLAR